MRAGHSGRTPGECRSVCRAHAGCVPGECLAVCRGARTKKGTRPVQGMETKKRAYSYFATKAINLVLVVAVFAVFSGWASEASAHDEQVAEQIAAAERAAQRGPYAQDGVFEGTAQGFGGPVTMRVTIDNGYIDTVEIADASKEDDAWLDMAKVLPDRIVKEQSTQIDVVSGATYTSSGILNGTTNALKKAAGGGAQ